MAYRHYVLILLLLVYIHCLLCRMLPAFLVSVPVPGCEIACAGAVTAPLCDRSSGWVAPAHPGLVDMGSFEECQDCRARVGAYKMSGLNDGGWFNMRDGACIVQWQYGILMGYGFALPFVLGSFATARYVDSVDRRGLLAAAIGVWSLASGLMAQLSSFLPLLASRFLLGVSEAAVVPAALSLVMQYFDEGSHGLVGSILSAGVCLGAGAASWAVPLSLQFGWRASCAAVGCVGLVLSVLVATTVREPWREEGTISCTTGKVGRSGLAVWVLTAAAAFRLAASYTIAAFLPIFYLRAQLPGYSPNGYATANAAIVACTGLLSALVGGLAADYFSSSAACAPCLIAAGAQVIAALMFIGVFRASTFNASLGFYGMALLVGECWYGLTLVQVKNIVAQDVQGRTLTVVLSVATIVSNISPVAVGILDPLTADGLAEIMLGVITSCILVASGLLFLAAWCIESASSRADTDLTVEFIPFLDEPDQASPLRIARRESRLETFSDAVRRRQSQHTFFAAPGLADIVVPDVALDNAPMSPLFSRSKTLPASLLQSRRRLVSV